MDTTTKDALAVSIAVPALFTVLLFAAFGSGIACFCYAILAFCFAPVSVFGAMMLTRPDAGRWVNLPVHEDCEHIDAIAHMFGASIIIGDAGISIAVSLIVQGCPALIGGLLIAASIGIIILPMAYIKRRPADFWFAPSSWSRPSKTAVIILSAVLAVAPIGACEFLYDGSAEVIVDFDGDSITITAPLFDHTLRYDGIADVILDEDFDRGHRCIGYSGADIGSGTYENRSLGSYELAAYKNVAMCILVSFEGEVYAFNKSTEEETRAVYEELLIRTGMARSWTSWHRRSEHHPNQCSRPGRMYRMPTVINLNSRLRVLVLRSHVR